MKDAFGRNYSDAFAPPTRSHLGVTAKEGGQVAAGFATGAAGGAAVGSMIFPPIGTIVGAAAGSIAGAVKGGLDAAAGRKDTIAKLSAQYPEFKKVAQQLVAAKAKKGKDRDGKRIRELTHKIDQWIVNPALIPGAGKSAVGTNAATTKTTASGGAAPAGVPGTQQQAAAQQQAAMAAAAPAASSNTTLYLGIAALAVVVLGGIAYSQKR